MPKSFYWIFCLIVFSIQTFGDDVAFLSPNDSKPLCDQVNSSVPWKYCFSAGAGKNARRLILQFHGGGESEKTWFDSDGIGDQVRRSWRSSGFDEPSVVSISFGPMWLLSRKSSLPQSGLYEVFVNEVVPYIEKQLMHGQIVERAIIGHSMGGFNAGTFGLQNLSQFSRIALLCPALGSEGGDIDAYIKTTGAEPQYAQYLFKIRDQYYSSVEAESSSSPLTLIQNLSPSKIGPRFFLSCGDRDQYGFYHAASTFVGLVGARGFQVIWKPVANGQHCSVEIDSLAKFLL